MRIAVISSHNVHSLKHKHPEHEWFLAMDAGEHSKLMDNNSEFYSFNPDVVLFSLEGDCDVYSGRVARHLPNTPIFIQYNLPSVKKPLKFIQDNNKLKRLQSLNLEYSNVRYMEAPKIDFDPYFYYFANVVYTDCALLYNQIMTAYNAYCGIRKKCLVLDLDNTLWGGVLGEQGIEGVQLSDEGWTRCYHDFQKNIQLLAESGVILALCSKNDEPTAIAAIDNHPYMILRWKSFAAWRINWNDKATNLVELSKELNIGLDSFVFIDDSAYERGLIKASLPEVFVPDFPDKPEFLPDFIANLDCFETFEITHEDEERNRMYDEERKRKAIQQEFPNYENFLTSLNILVHIEEMNETNIGRISQIFARTNQFNFSGVKYTTEELKQLKHHTVFCIRYKDNIGDLGIVGAAVVAHYNQDHLLENMAISCRSLSRGVEEYFFKSLQHKFPGTFRYSYKPTAKNEPVRKFIESLSIDYDSKELPPWIKHLDQWS